MMTTASMLFYWLGAASLIAAAVLGWRLLPQWRPMTWAGVGLLTVAALLRWIVTAHPPIFGTFENTIAAGWMIALYVLIAAGVRDRGPLGPRSLRYLLAWVPMLLAYGWFFNMTPYPLTISERSIIVDIHVLFAWLAFAVLLHAAMVALVVATRGADDEPGADHRLFKGVATGFVLFSAMLAVGSIYSYLLFGTWYAWELVETFAFIGWLGYGAVIHARLLFGWKGKPLAYAVLSLLPVLLATFWIWSIYSNTYHFFDIPEIRAG